MSVRWLGPRACPTCGRWGGHASWCADVNRWLAEIETDRAAFVAAALEEAKR